MEQKFRTLKGLIKDLNKALETFGNLPCMIACGNLDESMIPLRNIFVARISDDEGTSQDVLLLTDLIKNSELADEMN